MVAIKQMGSISGVSFKEFDKNTEQERKQLHTKPDNIGN